MAEARECEPQVAQVVSVDADGALGGVVEARDEVGQRGLAGAGRTDQRDELPRPWRRTTRHPGPPRGPGSRPRPHPGSRPSSARSLLSVFVSDSTAGDVLHAAPALDIAEQPGLVHGVAEVDAIELELAAHVVQRNGAALFDDVLRQIDDLEDALEGDHGGAELHRRADQALQRRIQRADIGAEGDDGADGEGALDDQVAAEAVGQRRAQGADDAQQGKQGHTQDGAADADIADAGGALAEAAFLIGLAAEELDQQRPADIEGLVHVGVHLGVEFHGPARHDAQLRAQPAGHQRQERQDDQGDQRKAPLEGEHDRQDGDGLDQVGDDVGDGVADGVLRADHVVVQAAHQLAHAGIGEEAQRHALKARQTATSAGRR